MRQYLRDVTYLSNIQDVSIQPNMEASFEEDVVAHMGTIIADLAGWESFLLKLLA